MMKVSCIQCNSKFISHRNKHKKEKIFTCLKCWTTKSNASLTTVQLSNKDSTKDLNDIFLFGIGDFAYVNTDKYGVLKVKIKGVDLICDNAYYTIELKDKLVEYVEEDAIFISLGGAKESLNLIKV